MDKKTLEWFIDIREYLNKHKVKHTAAGVELWARNSYTNKKALLDLLGADHVKVGTSESAITLEGDSKLVGYIYYAINELNTDLRSEWHLEGKINDILHEIDRKSENNILVRDLNQYEHYDFMKAVNPKFRLPKAGMKLSKILSKWLGNEELNIYLSKKLQENKQMEIHIGMRPIDFLSMSDGNNWNSCHSIRNDGCYQTGGASLMQDKVSLVAWAGKWEDKEWRQMIYLSPGDSTFVTSRSYPFVNPSASKVIEEYLKGLLFDEGTRVYETKGENNRYFFDHDFRMDDDGDIYIDEDEEYFYHDILYGYTDGVKGFSSMKDINPVLRVGASVQCPKCGEYLYGHNSIVCCVDEDQDERCSRCGGMHSYLVRHNGEEMCDSCRGYLQAREHLVENRERARELQIQLTTAQREAFTLSEELRVLMLRGGAVPSDTLPPRLQPILESYNISECNHHNQDSQYYILDNFEDFGEIHVDHLAGLYDVDNRLKNYLHAKFELERLFHVADTVFACFVEPTSFRRFYADLSTKELMDTVNMPSITMNFRDARDENMEKLLNQHKEVIGYLAKNHNNASDLLDMDQARIMDIALHGEASIVAQAAVLPENIQEVVADMVEEIVETDTFTTVAPDSHLMFSEGVGAWAAITNNLGNITTFGQNHWYTPDNLTGADFDLEDVPDTEPMTESRPVAMWTRVENPFGDVTWDLIEQETGELLHIATTLIEAQSINVFNDYILLWEEEQETSNTIAGIDFGYLPF